VIYIFYKNALLVLPQFFFGIFSQYSGQNFYYDGFYQLYNVIYTAFPIIALGVRSVFRALMPENDADSWLGL
jgi:magnesium-transporting ATPase (P-type)